jgi:hypothetical protein
MAVKKSGGSGNKKLNDFLKSPKTRGMRCETCSGPQEIKDAIVMFSKAQETGSTDQSMSAFYRFLVDEYDFPRGETALYNHIANCVRGRARRSAR